MWVYPYLIEQTFFNLASQYVIDQLLLTQVPK